MYIAKQECIIVAELTNLKVKCSEKHKNIHWFIAVNSSLNTADMSYKVQ